MIYRYTRQGIEKKEKAWQRFFELLPASASWGILLGMPFLSFVRPIAAAVLIIAFGFYWLLRLFYMTLFLVLAYCRLFLESHTDWMARLRGMEDLDGYLKKLQERKSKSGWMEKISLGIHETELRRLPSAAPPPHFDEIYHLVIFPVKREKKEVLEPGIVGLLKQNFLTKKMLVVFALEGSAAQEVRQGIEEIRERYRSYFYDFWVVTHPEGVPGEAPVKGANATFAARKAADHFQERKVPFENVIVSCFDADTVVSPEYFSALTYHYLICPHRNRASFQPIPVYHNNIWEAPAFSRALDIGASFFQLIEATNPDKLVTFSSHSMSFKALVDVGYWPVDMVSDDSAIFWKAFIHYDGDYRVIPMYVTLSMDVVTAENWWKTAQAVYRQKRRWAWGVENFPLVMRAFLKNKMISRWDRVRLAFKMFENHVTWATWPFLFTVIIWLPVFFAGREFSSSVVYYSTPRITAIIFNLASLTLITTIILSLCLLPKKKVRHAFLKRAVLAFEWLLIPAIVTFLSALPALDAQTRLALGKSLPFWVTEKERP